MGKTAPKTIDFVEDDVVTVEHFLDLISVESYSNRVSVRLISCALLIAGIAAMVLSGGLDSAINSMPLNTILETKMGPNAKGAMAMHLSFVLTVGIMAVPWLQHRAMSAFFNLAISFAGLYALTYSV